MRFQFEVDVVSSAATVTPFYGFEQLSDAWQTAQDNKASQCCPKSQAKKRARFFRGIATRKLPISFKETKVYTRGHSPGVFMGPWSAHVSTGTQVGVYMRQGDEYLSQVGVYMRPGGVFMIALRRDPIIDSYGVIVKMQYPSRTTNHTTHYHPATPRTVGTGSK